MLGKLVKNEIKASAHTMANIYIAALITFAIMMLGYYIDVEWLSWLPAVATLVMIAIAFISLVVTFIGVIANFSKTLYGPQGYLSFTLPVSSSALLAAKAIVSFFWMLISYIISIAILFGVYMYALSIVGEDNVEMIKMLLNMFSTLPSDAAIKQLVILLVLSVFIQLAFLIAELFFAITFANTRVLQKLGAAGPILVFFAVFVVSQILLVLFTTHAPIIVTPDESGLLFHFGKTMAETGGMAIGISGFLFQIVAAVGLFAATGWLMKHKVNIK